jgi:hypothetical protein
VAQEALRFVVVHSSQLAQQQRSTCAGAQVKEAEGLSAHVRRVEARRFACVADAEAAIAEYEGRGQGHRRRRWVEEKKAGWHAVLAAPQMPVTSTLLDQAHNAIDRKFFAMKGFHHPGESHRAFLTGLAHLYNLIPYQRRAQPAGQCGVEVEGGRVPTEDWFSICRSSPRAAFDEE